MNKELQSIIRNLQNTLNGQPWFGRAVMALIDEVDASKADSKPNGKDQHSLNELLYHMINWAEFCLNAVAGDKPVEYYDENDWRTLSPAEHTWQQGVEKLKTVHEQLMEQLQTKDDAFLKETVTGRKYNFRFMLNGLIQHNIYHAGQIAYITKYIL